MLVSPHNHSLPYLFFPAIRSGTENQPAKKARGDGTGTDGTGGGRDHLAYGCLLRNELLGAEIDELRGPPNGCAEGNRAALGAVQLASAAKAALAYSPPVFRFRAPGHNAEVRGRLFEGPFFPVPAKASDHYLTHNAIQKL